MNRLNTVPNTLANEKSAYLLQHAYNPVDWYPWCEEAFERAKTENKPIFMYWLFHLPLVAVKLLHPYNI